MRFKLSTLVDITETNIRRNNKSLEFRQQQNFQTVLQTIGLRVNVYKYTTPEVKTRSVNNLFGMNYKQKHNVWEFEFEIEHSNALEVDMLKQDFNMVPVITDLTETAKFEKNIFYSESPELCNVLFEKVDK